MTIKIIQNYIKKTYYSNILFDYSLFIKKKNIFNIFYFFWYNETCFTNNIKGYCFKSKRNSLNISTFSLYYTYKTIRIKQLFFFISPFIFLIKKKRLKNSIKKKIFLF